MNYSNQLIKQKDIVVKNIKTYLKDNGFSNLVIGISGGIDSAVGLHIISEAVKTKQNIFAYFIDIESSKKDYQDAKKVCEQINIKLNYINLNKVYKSFIKLTKPQDQTTKNNIKSRLRMIYLYEQANEHQALVCSNSNLDELYIGYFTKYGDNACDLFILNNFNKSEIYELAHYYHVDQSIINKPPSAGLSINQTDEKEIGISYSIIDKYLENKLIDKKHQDKIKVLHKQNAHKLFYNYDINSWDKYKHLWKKRS